jgi:ornithine cyclodeaminase/alanine dehydrogenase-like protein (mu-crystallin family)
LLSLGADELRNALPMRECIEAMEEMFKSEPRGFDSQPVEGRFQIDEESRASIESANSPILKRFVVKVSTHYERSQNKEARTTGGITALIDSERGEPLIAVDAQSLTAIRTGGVAGLATRFMARRDSRRLVVLGAGGHARAIVEGVCAVRDIEQATICSKTPERALLFAKEIQEKLGVDCKTSDDRKAALRDGEIVVLATNSLTPVISWEEMAVGAHIISVGNLQGQREVDNDTICNSSLFVDTRDGVLKRAADIAQAIRLGLITESNIAGDLALLSRGEAKARLFSENQITLFKSVGFAMQDAYAANRAYENTRSKK